jgi:APA family basic amino acid/polyamine antiporter
MVPLVPALGAVICLAQMVGLPLQTWLRLVIWLVAGLLIYAFYSRREVRQLQTAGTANAADTATRTDTPNTAGTEKTTDTAKTAVRIR